MLAALQMIMDNRRHAQETIRFQKARVFFFVVFAFLATLQAKALCPVVHVKSDVQNAVYIAFQLLPVGIILSIPVAFLPHALHFPGVTDRSTAWRLGLAPGEAAALLAAIQVETDALRKELASIDLHAIVFRDLCDLRRAPGCVWSGYPDWMTDSLRLSGRTRTRLLI